MSIKKGLLLSVAYVSIGLGCLSIAFSLGEGISGALCERIGAYATAWVGWSVVVFLLLTALASLAKPLSCGAKKRALEDREQLEAIPPANGAGMAEVPKKRTRATRELKRVVRKTYPPTQEQ